jgi:Ca2+-binding RTX toxin-like protein
MHHYTTMIKSTTTTTLVIFDSQVADLPLLHIALIPGSIAHTIQPHQDSIDTITQLLTETGATKLAIVAHGQPGAIQIGNGVIDRAMLETRSGLLQEWGVDSIALYSCEVGLDAEFVQRFSELTGAQIAASTNKVGAGNWELAGGERMLSIGQLADYSGTLATFTGTSGNDNADQGFFVGIPASLTGFTSTNVIAIDLVLLTDATGDTFNGGAGNDVVGAGIGDDILNGEAGNDTLDGSDGNDIIRGGAAFAGDGLGSNFLIGGAGNDRIDADMKDTIYGGADNDFLYVFTAVDGANYKVIFTAPNAGTLSTNGLQTGSFNDIEQLYFAGYNGNDIVDASLANLTVTTPGASYAALQLNGYGGNDTLIGSAGNDKIEGGDGNDTITGNAGSNTLYGDAGDDYINASSMRDNVEGGSGNDFLIIETVSPTDAYTVEFTGANAGKFKINGVQTGIFTSIEQLAFVGGNGNDIINASAATLSVTASGSIGPYVLFVDGGAGSDTVLGSAGKDYIFGYSDNDFLYGQGGDDGIAGGDGFDIIFGGSGVDVIGGGTMNDTIFGGTEGDDIYGNDGEDYLYGEDGNDKIYGGYGFDVIYGQAGDDLIYGEGVDFDFVSGIETTVPVIGLGINDTIFGGIGIDTIYGGIGVDEIYGEADGDSIFGGDDTDFLFGQAGDDAIGGDAGNDYLVGGDGNDSLYGGSGIDTLIGENGDDYLVGNVGDDALYGNDGNDFLNGGIGNDFLDGGIGNDSFFGDNGNDVLFGGDGEDYLYGENGDDYLYGEAGNDTLGGGTGSDFLIGGAGSDKFRYFAMTDAGDTITDFNPLASGDNLDLSNLFNNLPSQVDNSYLQFSQSGANTLVRVDPNGAIGGANFVTMATLNNVTATQLSFAVGGNVLV